MEKTNINTPEKVLESRRKLLFRRVFHVTVFSRKYLLNSYETL